MLRKKFKFIFVCIIIALFLVLLLFQFPIWRAYKLPEYYWNAEEARELMFAGTWSERKKVSDIVNHAKEALSAIETNKIAAQDKYGQLSRYVVSKDVYPDAVKVTYSLQLCTAHCEEDSGYMWVRYSQKAYDADNEEVYASLNVMSKWDIAKDANGNWYVTNIKEAP